jgi:N6-L-threonylcarbamoyladenine synthase
VKILAIETSCDETAAAVVENGWNVLSNEIGSSVEQHKRTNGIVPEVAARDAEKKVFPVVENALKKANCTMEEIDALAVTAGPGLMGSLLVGVESARMLAYIHKKPLIPVHHITGHICANRLTRNRKIDFPALVLTVSGGHNEIVLWKNDFEFECIGHSIDDAAGEAFDKGARMLGLGFPGGPAIEKASKIGFEEAFKFPRPMLNKDNDFRFSFSGLKTALLYKIEELGGIDTLEESIKNDLAASFQEAIVDTLAGKLFQALNEYRDVKEVHLTGGVSANKRLRHKIFERTEKMHIGFYFPEKMEFCTDNAAMIASAAYWKYMKEPEANWAWQSVHPHLEREFF